MLLDAMDWARDSRRIQRRALVVATSDKKGERFLDEIGKRAEELRAVRTVQRTMVA